MIHNKLLRLLLLPLAVFSWSVQFMFWGFLSCVGMILFMMSLLMVILFGDKIEKELAFIVFIGWWAYYPWLWWYRYITTGDLRVLEEFRDK